MSHPYFFVDKNCITPGSVTLGGEDFRHLVRVLRARVGDIVEISDNEAKRYKTVLAGISKDEALLEIKQTCKIIRKSHCISLFMCVLKKEAMELAIQKTTEIGVDRIIPVLSARTVVEIEGKKTKDKIFRWQQIALSASKQCKRDFICEITGPVDVEGIDVREYALFFLPVEELYQDEWEDFAPELKGAAGSLKDVAKVLNDRAAGISAGGSSSRKTDRKTDKKTDWKTDKNNAADFEDINIIDSSKTEDITKGPNNNESGASIPDGPNLNSEIAFIIGPEGGFEKKEVSGLVKKGAVPINFGANILRAETASIYFTSILDYLLKI